MDLDLNEGLDLNEVYVLNEGVDLNEENVVNEEVGDTSDPSDGVLPHPKMGMCFDDAEDFAKWCHKYAYQTGFQWHTRNSKLFEEYKGRYGNKKGQEEAEYHMMVKLRLGCVKAGKATKYKKSQATGCPVFIHASYVEDRFKIKSLKLKHNHLLSPSNSRLMINYKYMPEHHKMRIMTNDRAGVPVTKNFNSLFVENGGHENLPYSKTDMRNVLNTERRSSRQNGDASALEDYLESMEADNPDFFSEIKRDSNGALVNVFWADARCRSMAKDFGDVVTFDTTHQTNRYGMPFAPFIGVNHHGSSVVLAGGIIRHEDADAFAWLFRCWLKCMKKAPDAILTDQCKAIGKAVQMVFPSTRHRLCVFHIMQNANRNLGSHVYWKEIKERLHVVLHNSMDLPEFEEAWREMVEEFDLHHYTWIQESYRERERWASGYWRSSFWAGMSSTQRSEGLNFFFKGYLNTHTGLKLLVEQYQLALSGKVEEEKILNAQSMDKPYTCNSTILVEEVFHKAYTNNKFKEVKEEVEGLLHTNATQSSVHGNKTTYKVDEKIVQPVWRTRKKSFWTTIDRGSMEFKCSCNLFEFKGILCRNIIRVIDMEEIPSIPEKYVLNRWRKNIVREYESIKVKYYDPKEAPRVKRFCELSDRNQYLVYLALHNEETYNIFLKGVDEIEKRLEEVLGIISNPVLNGIRGLDAKNFGKRRLQKKQRNERHNKSRQPADTECWKDPPDKKGKGRPKGKRTKHPAETPSPASKKKKINKPRSKKAKATTEETTSVEHVTRSNAHCSDNHVSDTLRTELDGAQLGLRFSQNDTMPRHSSRATPSYAMPPMRVDESQVSSSRWIPQPRRECLKISTCGLSNGVNGDAGGGGIIMSGNGNVMRCYVSNLGHANTVTAALRGILYGMKIIQNWPTSNVLVECNSAEACAFVNMEGEAPESDLLKECWSLIHDNRCREVTVKVLPEWGKSTTGALAKYAIEFGSTYAEFDAVPPDAAMFFTS